MRSYQSLDSFRQASLPNLTMVHTSDPEANVCSYRQTDSGNIFCGLQKQISNNLDGWDLSSALLKFAGWN